MDISRLKAVLEGLYAHYNHRRFILPDPLQFVYRYSKQTDMELAGLFAAVMAYGAVEQIERFVGSTLEMMGPSCSEFVGNLDAADCRRLQKLKYRFNHGGDFTTFFRIMQSVLRKSGGLKEFFLEGYDDSAEDICPSLESFVRRLMSFHRGTANAGLRFMLTKPSDGSACKRMFLFLRWMVRKDEVDSGLWADKIDRAKLIVPVDVHIGRLSRILGLHNRSTLNLNAARHITANLRLINPQDPLKYDFALCRIGILENCSGRLKQTCELCRLFEYCNI